MVRKNILDQQIKEFRPLRDLEQKKIMTWRVLESGDIVKWHYLVQPAKLKNRYLGTMYLNDSVILRFSVSFVEGIKVKTID